MPLLNGPKVRHRAAALGWDLSTLAERSRLPQRAVQNCTRTNNPQTMKLDRIYAIGGALAEASGEDRYDVTADIVDDPTLADEVRAAKDDPPKREPTGPARRQENEKTTGPKRATGAAA